MVMSAGAAPNTAAIRSSSFGTAAVPVVPLEDCVPRSKAKIVAACRSAANNTPFGPNASGPIDENEGPTAVGTSRAASGADVAQTANARMAESFNMRIRVSSDRPNADRLLGILPPVAITE